MTGCINPSDRVFESSPCLGFHLRGGATVTSAYVRAPDRRQLAGLTRRLRGWIAFPSIDLRIWKWIVDSVGHIETRRLAESTRMWAARLILGAHW